MKTLLVVVLGCIAGACVSNEAKAQIVGQWMPHNTGWFDIAWSHNGGPVNGQPTILCGVFNPAVAQGDVQCLDAPSIQFSVNFTSTGRSAAYVAVQLGGIWVADTTGELWFGTSTNGPIVHTTNPLQMSWVDKGPLPGGCSCGDSAAYPPPAICSNQLATDASGALFAVGCDGNVYEREAQSGTYVNVSSVQNIPHATSIGYSPWQGEMFALADVPYSITTSGWVANQGWSQFQWTSTSSPQSFRNNINLTNCYGNFSGNGCVMALGGSNIVLWNSFENTPPLTADDALLDFQQYQGIMGEGSPPSVGQFGRYDGWNEFSYNEAGGNVGAATFASADYSFSTIYPAIYRIADGGTGIATQGYTDVSWIVTNIGRLFSFEMPASPPLVYQLPPGSRHFLPHVAWQNLNIPQKGCPPTCAVAKLNFWDVGVSGAVYARSFLNGAWATPIAVTATNFAPSGASVVAALQTTTAADIFVAANDGKVYVASTASDATWQAPVALTAANFAKPGAALATTTQGQQLNVFVVDALGKLEQLAWTPTFGWLGPVALTSANYAPPSAALATGTRSNGEVDVYSVGTTGALQYMAFNYGFWSGPYTLTVTNFAPAGTPVAAALDVHGYMNVMLIGNDGALYTKWDATPLWSGPTALTATGFAPPGGSVSAINSNNQSLNAFVIDNSGTIDGLSNAGSSWQGPTAIGVRLAAPGAATGVAVEGTNELHLFAVATGTGSGVVESVNSGGGWSAPVVMP